jgi:predicted transcriptional regulator
MATKTLTFSVDAEVEKKFRKVARAARGSKKGYLGKALTDAMEKWTKEMEGADTVAAAMALLDQGVDLGGMKYGRRDELHER